MTKICLFFLSWCLFLSVQAMGGTSTGPSFLQHPIRACRFALLGDETERNLAHLPRALRRYEIVRQWSAFFGRFTYDYASHGAVLNLARGSDFDHRTAHFATYKNSDTRVIPTPEWVKVDFSSWVDPDKILITYKRSFSIAALLSSVEVLREAQRIPLRVLFLSLMEFGKSNGMDKIPKFSVKTTTQSYEVTFEGRYGAMIGLLETIRDRIPDPKNIPEIYKHPLVVDKTWFSYFFGLWDSVVETEETNGNFINFSDVVASPGG